MFLALAQNTADVITDVYRASHDFPLVSMDYSTMLKNPNYTISDDRMTDELERILKDAVVV